MPAPGEDLIGKANILLVDDEADALEEMKLCLEDEGFMCVTAGSAAQANQVWREAQPIGVVVTDIRMPDGNGLQLLSSLVAAESGTAPEAIVITGYGSVDSAISALRLHVADFLRKPVGRSTLIAAVQGALERYNKRRLVEEERKREISASRLLRSTGERLNDLVRELLADVGDEPVRGSRPEKGSTVTPTIVRRLIDERTTRAEFFREDNLAEVGWDMLLELLLAQLEDRRVYVRSLCNISLLPSTSALRRINDLERSRLVTRSTDPYDRRRVIIELSQEGTRRMMSYVDQINRSCPS